MTFPEYWDIYHSENHWSNQKTMFGVFVTILLTYILEQGGRLNIPLKQSALVIFNVNAAHLFEFFINKLQKIKIA